MMGQLDVLTCIYCGQILDAMPVIDSESGRQEALYYCVCGGVASVALEN